MSTRTLILIECTAKSQLAVTALMADQQRGSTT